MAVLYRWNGSSWDAVGGQSGSSVVKDYERKQRTSGNWTLNSTSWANLDTGLDLTINAAAGDIVEVGMSGRYDSNESVTVSLDVGSLVSGAIVKTWGADAAEAAGFNGVPGWFGSYQALHAIGGSVCRAVEAGDISGGVLTLRFRYKTGSATNRVLNGTTNNPLIVWATNHGPITP